MAGKDIAQRFSKHSEGYLIRYARENPRSANDEPDEFEKKALALFSTGETREYYGVEEYNGKMVFRYTSVIKIRSNCLSCHGEPAGGKDEIGYIKEGMEIGDIAGLSSIIIPMDLYEKEAKTRMTQTIGFFLALLIIVIAVIRFALQKWVTEPLTQANLELFDENEAKSNFLTIISHELRTPLSSIMAFTDIWEKAAHHKDEDEQRLVREIKENSSILLNMINNTIDVAKLEAGWFEIIYDEVDLVDVMNSVVAVAHPLAVKHDIFLVKRISMDIPIIISDGEVLRKIVMNLVSNAIKYTAAGGKVEITASYLADIDRVVIRVADTGFGIPEDDMERIFQRFTQSVQRGDARKNGSGLGLFLVRTLAEKLGGEIRVESVVEKGSIFSVYIPTNNGGLFK